MRAVEGAVRGRVAPGYERVRAAMQEMYNKGWEVGSSFVAFCRGECVVR